MRTRRTARIRPDCESVAAPSQPPNRGRFALFSRPLNKPRTRARCLVTPLNTAKQTGAGMQKRLFSASRRLTSPNRVEAWHPSPGTSPNLRSTSLHFGVS